MTRTSTAKLLLLAGAAFVAACSSSGRIDGTSAATFERSVAILQNDLPPRRRDDFDVALAIIWTRAAGVSRDVDGDGDVDYFDARITADAAGDLLSAIARGDLVSTIEDSKGKSVAAAYFTQLDGLGYHEVIGLAGARDVGRHVAGLKRQVSRAGCDGWKGAGDRPPLGNTSRIRRCE